MFPRIVSLLLATLIVANPPVSEVATEVPRFRGHPVYVPIDILALGKAPRDDQHRPAEGTMRFVRLGLPIPDHSKIETVNQLVASGPQASQFRVIDRWPSGNIRWVQVDAMVDIKKLPALRHIVVSSGAGKSSGEAMATASSEGGITISTGAAQFTIALENSTIHLRADIGQRIWLNGDIRLDRADENSAFDTVEIEENGPVRSVIKATGRDGTARFTFLKNRSEIQIRAPGAEHILLPGIGAVRADSRENTAFRILGTPLEPTLVGLRRIVAGDSEFEDVAGRLRVRIDDAAMILATDLDRAGGARASFERFRRPLVGRPNDPRWLNDSEVLLDPAVHAVVRRHYTTRKKLAPRPVSKRAGPVDTLTHVMDFLTRDGPDVTSSLDAAIATGRVSEGPASLEGRWLLAHVLADRPLLDEVGRTMDATAKRLAEVDDADGWFGIGVNEWRLAALLARDDRKIDIAAAVESRLDSRRGFLNCDGEPLISTKRQAEFLMALAGFSPIAGTTNDSLLNVMEGLATFLSDEAWLDDPGGFLDAVPKDGGYRSQESTPDTVQTPEGKYWSSGLVNAGASFVHRHLLTGNEASLRRGHRLLAMAHELTGSVTPPIGGLERRRLLHHVQNVASAHCWRDLVFSVGSRDGQLELTYVVPPGARAIRIKYADRPIVPSLRRNAASGEFGVHPEAAVPFFAAHDVKTEPIAAPGGETQSVLLQGLASDEDWHFAMRYLDTPPRLRTRRESGLPEVTIVVEHEGPRARSTGKKTSPDDAADRAFGFAILGGALLLIALGVFFLRNRVISRDGDRSAVS